MKPLLPLTSDEEAEAFVASADLTDYNLSGMVTVRFERTAEAGAVVLPNDLLIASRDRAAALGVTLDVFIRSAIERALSAD